MSLLGAYESDDEPPEEVSIQKNSTNSGQETVAPLLEEGELVEPSTAATVNKPGTEEGRNKETTKERSRGEESKRGRQRGPAKNKVT